MSAMFDQTVVVCTVFPQCAEIVRSVPVGPDMLVVVPPLRPVLEDQHVIPGNDGRAVTRLVRCIIVGLASTLVSAVLVVVFFIFGGVSPVAAAPMRAAVTIVILSVAVVIFTVGIVLLVASVICVVGTVMFALVLVGLVLLLGAVALRVRAIGGFLIVGFCGLMIAVRAMVKGPRVLRAGLGGVVASSMRDSARHLCGGAMQQALVVLADTAPAIGRTVLRTLAHGR
jgi:hypothetical protein